MKKHLFLLLFIGLLESTILFAQINPSIIHEANSQVHQKIEFILDSLSIKEQIGQLIFPQIYPSLKEADLKNAKKLIKAGAFGGILFQKGEAYEQYKMTLALQKESKLPLLISADAEWGLAMRLDNSIRYPRNRALRNIKDLRLIYLYGESVGKQCKRMGIHINFAPVLDINSNPNNPVIGTRSFGESKKEVRDYSIAYAKGLETQKILSVAKHFPGHGDTSTDSHKVLPKIKKTQEELFDLELSPFKHYINEGLGGLMIGHLNIPALDSNESPASLSYPIVCELLQKELFFSGLIFTDGMQMKGLKTKNKLPISVLALLAGNDVLLAPKNPIQAIIEIEDAVKNGIIDPSIIREHCKKILLYKWGLMEHSLKKKPTALPISKKKFFYELNSPEAIDLANQLWLQSIQFDKTKENLFPLSKQEANIGLLTIGNASYNDQVFLSTLHSFGIKPLLHKSISNKTSKKTIKKFIKIFKNCSTIFIHCYNAYPNKLQQKAIQELSKKNKRVIFTLFTSPYQLTKWKKKLAKTLLVINAYEGCKETQRCIANLYYNKEYQKSKIVQVPQGESFLSNPNPPPFNPSPKEKELAKNLNSKWKDFNNIIFEGLDNEAFPGCQVAILHKSKIVYNNSFGKIDTSPNSSLVNDFTLYDLASITKAIVTTPIIMKLIADKKMRLSDKIERFIPELKRTKVGKSTIKSLLLHESGLRPTINFYLNLLDSSSFHNGHFFSHKSIKNWIQVDSRTYAPPYVKFNPKKVAKTKKGKFQIPFGNSLFISTDFKKEILNEIAKSPIQKRKKTRYSDVGFILLGIAAENITKKDLHRLSQELIFRPMQCSLLGFLPLERFDAKNIAPTQKKCFLRGVFKACVDDESSACLGGVAGNAGLFGNALEIAKIGQMFLQKGFYNSKKIIPQKVVKKFLSTKGIKGKRCLGFKIGEAEKDVPSNTSSKIFGHTGFTGCAFWVDPVNELIFVFLSNRTYKSRNNKAIYDLNIRYRLLETTYNILNL